MRTNGGALIIDPPTVGRGTIRRAHHFRKEAGWRNMVVVLALGIRVTIAAVVGPSLLVTVQENAIGENSNNIIRKTIAASVG